MCNAGEKLTNGFLKVGDLIYDCPWHRLPIKLRKYIPCIIAVSQRPVYIQGYGNIKCTRETFKSVNKSTSNINFGFFCCLSDALKKNYYFSFFTNVFFLFKSRLSKLDLHIS